MHVRFWLYEFYKHGILVGYSDPLDFFLEILQLRKNLLNDDLGLTRGELYEAKDIIPIIKRVTSVYPQAYFDRYYNNYWQLMEIRLRYHFPTLTPLDRPSYSWLYPSSIQPKNLVYYP